MDDHDEIKKKNTDLIQHEIPQNCIKKTRKYKRKVKYKYESRYTKLSQFMTFHCQICSSKKYTVFSSYKEHMANWHGVAPKTLNEQFLESIKKERKYKPRIKKSNTVITEVEKQMPLELKNDDSKVSENSAKNKFYSGTKQRRKYKPRIKKSNTVITEVENPSLLELKNDDNKISENSTDHIKPEKSYQIPINSNSCVSHKSMTLDDNITLDTSDEAGTNADTSNNKNESLNVLNDNCTISIPANDNINSMDVVDNDTSTLQDFASVSDFEKHQQCNIYENLIICQNQKNVMACEPKEHYINANYNELFNSEIIPPSIPSKDTWTPDENHMKALNEICVVQQPFYCGFCKEMCEQYDHYQLNQWCSFNENLKCHVCYQEFSDRKQLELHEREHVKLHFC
ncbi:unnamed protein product [Aphis gossypii]|uniref:C2H2-type domain-containing protein n=1 Tax=Aphis gossypii TaxID=80765 RepID=A0A9P0NJU9_APHGO|nr:unnamed protein product [Aphis gossypii]